MKISRVPDLALTINRWVSFQQMVGRGGLLSEHYLGQPVAEYLLHRHAGLLTPEDDHPILQTGTAGRPRQLDYTLRHRQSKKLNIAFECKWISGKAYDNQRILNDLLRLEILAGSGNSEPTCFFIVAGLVENFNLRFRDLQLNHGGSRVPFTRTLFTSPTKPKNMRHTVKVQHAHHAMRPFFRQFALDYKSTLPTKFDTKIIARTVEDGIAVSIWQIYSQKRRATFDPKVKWSDA